MFGLKTWFMIRSIDNRLTKSFESNYIYIWQWLRFQHFILDSLKMFNIIRYSYMMLNVWFLFATFDCTIAMAEAQHHSSQEVLLGWCAWHLPAPWIAVEGTGEPTEQTEQNEQRKSWKKTKKETDRKKYEKMKERKRLKRGFCETAMQFNHVSSAILFVRNVSNMRSGAVQWHVHVHPLLQYDLRVEAAASHTSEAV